MTAREVVESPPEKQLFTAPGKFEIRSIADREEESTFALDTSSGPSSTSFPS